MDSRDYSKTVNTVVMPAATNAFLLSNATWDGRRSRSRSISFSFVSFLKKIEEGSVFSFLGKGREKKFFFYRLKRECVKVWPGPLSSRTPKELN